ncbi:MAG: DUF4340 domain-containing protein [Planctomycetes bacterium]|nr:DUF4340 domain-containing protein [Planctomycetota bacterium]
MKGMKRTTLILLLVGGAIAAAVWMERKHADDDKAKESQPVDLFLFGAEEVAKVEVKRGGVLVVLEKKESRWRITAPRDWPASTQRVMQVLGRVDPETKGDPIPAGQKQPEEAVSGLDKPELEILLTAADGKKSSVAFGKPLGAGDKVYARRAGQKETLTVAKWLIDAFDITAESMRDPGYCRFDVKEVEGINFATAGLDVQLARQGRGWRLKGTLDDLAEPQAAEDWAGALTALETSRFEARTKPSRADYGLDPAFASIEIRLKSRTIKVCIGTPVEEGSVRRWADTSDYPGEIGTLDIADLAVRTPRLELLRAGHALPWPLADVDAFVATGAVEFEVRKKDNQWSILKPAILPRFEPRRIDQMLRELSAAPAGAPHPPVEAPAGSIHLLMRWGSDEHSADLWSDGNVTYVRTVDPVRVIETPTALLWNHANAGPLFFRDPVVPTGLVPLQVKSIIIEKNGASWVEAEFVGAKMWKALKEVPGKELDSEKMSILCQRWSGMAAETYVRAAKDSPEVGLGVAPVWRVRIIPDPGRASSAEERVFLVGRDGPLNSMYAILEGDEGVFEVDPNAAGILRSGVWKE